MGHFPRKVLRAKSLQHLRLAKLRVYAGLGTGGGKVRALTSDSKLTLRWAPSQKGLFSECPQRQRPIAVRPDRSNTLPVASQIVNSPSTRMEPLLLIVIFAKLYSYTFHPENSAGLRPATADRIPISV